MTILDLRRAADFRAALGCYEDLVAARLQSRADGLVWLRFDDRDFAVGDMVEPSGYLPADWQPLFEAGQLRLDRVYVVRASSPDHVSTATWNERRRWCYEVIPQQPLEPDPDRSHRFMVSRMCRAARVVRILRQPEPQPVQYPAP